MLLKRKRRLFVIFILLTGLALTLALSLYALKQNINLYYTPSQVAAGVAPIRHNLRIGGLVTKIDYKPHSLEVNFIVSDRRHTLAITYCGVLPDLFRLGIGVVVQGQLQADGTFKAEQVLAKHDEKYRPPNLTGIKSSIKAIPL